MDEEELSKQFKAMESNRKVKEAAGSTPPPPPTRKRTTIADLKKELEELRRDIDKDILTWIGELDVRLEGLEATTATHNKTLLSDVKNRLDALENAPTHLQPSFVPDITARMEMLENAIATLADAIKEIAADDAAPPPAAAEEIEFAAPPQQPAGEPIHAADIETVAAVAKNMTDVLMICRALAAATNTSDAERIRILDYACTRAKVLVTPGLQIRAGIRYVEA